LLLFFSTWTLVTFLSYNSLAWRLVRSIIEHRLRILFLISAFLWLALGCQALKPFLDLISETQQIYWVVVGAAFPNPSTDMVPILPHHALTPFTPILFSSGTIGHVNK